MRDTEYCHICGLEYPVDDMEVKFSTLDRTEIYLCEECSAGDQDGGFEECDDDYIDDDEFSDDEHDTMKNM